MVVPLGKILAFSTLRHALLGTFPPAGYLSPPTNCKYFPVPPSRQEIFPLPGNLYLTPQGGYAPPKKEATGIFLENSVSLKG